MKALDKCWKDESARVWIKNQTEQINQRVQIPSLRVTKKNLSCYSPVWIINFYGKFFLSEVQVFQLLPLVQLEGENVAMTMSFQGNRYYARQFTTWYCRYRDKRWCDARDNGFEIFSICSFSPDEYSYIISRIIYNRDWHQINYYKIKISSAGALESLFQPQSLKKARLWHTLSLQSGAPGIPSLQKCRC